MCINFIGWIVFYAFIERSARVSIRLWDNIDEFQTHASSFSSFFWFLVESAQNKHSNITKSVNKKCDSFERHMHTQCVQSMA